MRKLAIAALLIFTVCSSACWRTKQQMYSTLMNHSGAALVAVEVDYPGGSYGIPQLAPGDIHRKWVAVTTPCTYTIHFEDSKGKSYQSKPMEFGQDKCPAEIVFTVDTSMNITGAPK